MTGKSNLPLWDATTDKLSFNIAAEDGKTAAEGCFRPRNPDAVRPCKVLVSFASSQDHDDVYKDLYIHHSSSHQHNFTNTIPETNLQLRGWCFQELMMSTRILRFGKNQLSWCCLSTKASEAFRAGTEHGYDEKYKSFKGLMLRNNAQYASNERTQTPGHPPYYVWYWLVENFIGRSLSRGTDTLPALSGIAKEFQSLTTGRYCAGLWYNNLFQVLCWRRPEDYNHGGSKKINPGKRPSVPRAPSWSWASIDTDVIYWHNSNDQEAFVNIKSCDIDLSGENPFGEVIRGVLRLQGFLIEAYVTAEPDSVFRLKLSGKEDKWFANMDADEQDWRIQNVWCIPMIRIPVYVEDRTRLSHEAFSGLVLVQTGENKNEFSRVGRFTSGSKVNINRKRQEITII